MPLPPAYLLGHEPARPARRLARALHNRFAAVQTAGRERGTALVLTSISMLGILGMSAVAIDIAQWYQRSHQTQVAADAAALAAANCLANAGGTAPNDVCTSTTDTADATTVATKIAAANGIPIQASDITFGSNATVTVKASTTAPSRFAAIFGINSSTRSATSAASWSRTTSTATLTTTTPATTTTTPGTDTTTSGSSSTGNSCDSTQAAAGQCLLAFGMDRFCPDVGMTLENVGKETATGGIWSNSDLETVNADYNSTWGPVWYGNGSLCLWLGASVSNGPVFTSGPTAASPITTWPRDFRPLLACGPSDTYTCDGPYGTPSYCTKASPAFGLDLLGDVTSLASSALPQTVSDGQVYCAYGTGNPSDPSTWNGVMDMTTSSSASDSFIGGEVVLTSTGTATLSPQLDTSLGHVLVYANDAVAAANVATAGSASLSGNIFAPNGAITASSVGTGTFLGFVEGQQVVLDAQGSFVGEGPQISSITSSSWSGTTTTPSSTTTTPSSTTTTTTTTTTAGTDQLVQ